MINPKLPAIFYGGDYNPDQWPEEIWLEDMRLSKLANLNMLTLPVFSWAKLQPSEDVFDFEWLDRILDLIAKNGMYVCLATSTAAQPAWMSKKYPEILPVDFDGRKRKHGGRVNFCPSSTKFREFSTRLASKLAERYKDHPALLLWHVGNEYGNYCYCDNCASGFREWLRERYGTLEELNIRWNMNFWGHTVYDWDEIVVPSGLSEMWRDNGRERTCFQGISLDYNRYMSDASLACYKGEYDAIKAHCPDLPITTNLMGTFKPLDYFRWAEQMDIVSWDNYPTLGDPVSSVALRHDLMRGLKSGQPFMLMEQTPSQANWSPYNSLKKPGVMRLWSYQAIARGADTVLFFQLRRSIGACEKFHGAVIAHVGHENTRVFRECAQLGKELQSLGSALLDSKLKSRAAILFDWENWWAIEFSSGPTIELRYMKQIGKYYKALFDRNIPVDLIGINADFSRYDLVIAPVFHMVKPGIANKIEDFVEHGGTFVTTFFSGIVDENDRVVPGGYPGELRNVLGIWVEEMDALYPDARNSMILTAPWGNLEGSYECSMLCDVIHLKGAEALAVYGSDFYQGMPVLTCNQLGRGHAYYIGSDPEESFIQGFLENICSRLEIHAPLETAGGVEVTQRFKDGLEFTFILNHNAEAAEVDLKDIQYLNMLKQETVCGILTLEAKDVAILQRMV